MPGRRVCLNENCSWRERVGCEGVIVDPAIFGGIYPGDKPLRGEVIVLLDDDPIGVKNEQWTCVTDTRSVTSLP